MIVSLLVPFPKCVSREGKLPCSSATDPPVSPRSVQILWPSGRLVGYRFNTRIQLKRSGGKWASSGVPFASRSTFEDCVRVEVNGCLPQLLHRQGSACAPQPMESSQPCQSPLL